MCTYTISRVRREFVQSATRPANRDAGVRVQRIVKNSPKRTALHSAGRADALVRIPVSAVTFFAPAVAPDPNRVTALPARTSSTTASARRSAHRCRSK